MERRALEAAFSELADITSPTLQVERAQEIARHGAAAVPVLLSFLIPVTYNARWLGRCSAPAPAQRSCPPCSRPVQGNKASRLALLLHHPDRFCTSPWTKHLVA
jgi:hypothetical protein